MADSIFTGTMAEMTWRELEKLSAAGAIVLLSAEVLEEHGPHLPLAADVYLGCTIARRTQHHLSQQGVLSVIAPPNYWGMNHVTAGFPGSFTVRRETCKALLYDTLASFQRWGLERVFVIALHGDFSHRSALLEAIAEARLGCGTRAAGIVPDRYARYACLTGREAHVLIQPTAFDIRPFTEHQDMHAGAMETSFMQRYHPEQVDVAVAKTLEPTVFSPPDWPRWAAGWSDARGVIPEGYNGDPASIDPELAEAYVDAEARSIAGVIAAYLQGTYQPPDLTPAPLRSPAP